MWETTVSSASGPQAGVVLVGFADPADLGTATRRNEAEVDNWEIGSLGGIPMASRVRAVRLVVWETTVSSASGPQAGVVLVGFVDPADLGSAIRRHEAVVAKGDETGNWEIGAR